jgi:hypothetical protein
MRVSPIIVGRIKTGMAIDFFENGLCFYCHLAKNELQTYSEFHSETEASWKKKDDLLQKELDTILKKYPEADHDAIIESHGWNLHLNQIKYPDIHRTAFVVAIYVFLEDQLNGLCETLRESLDTKLRLSDLSGQGIERALLFMSKVALFNLGDISSLALVKNVNKLRNRLVHAGGILPNAVDDMLNIFVKQTRGLRGEPGRRVHIEANFIHALIEGLIGFFDELDGQVSLFMSRAQQSLQADGPAGDESAT